MNTVNPDNFNDTLKGYLIRALKEAKATEEERRRIFMGLIWAIDLMTMEEARKEYEKYRQGLIKQVNDIWFTRKPILERVV